MSMIPWMIGEIRIADFGNPAILNSNEFLKNGTGKVKEKELVFFTLEDIRDISLDDIISMYQDRGLSFISPSDLLLQIVFFPKNFDFIFTGDIYIDNITRVLAIDVKEKGPFKELLKGWLGSWGGNKAFCATRTDVVSSNVFVRCRYDVFVGVKI